jgi:hypothetical protein
MRNILQTRGVVLAALRDFCLNRQKQILPRKRSNTAEGSIRICEVFFSLVYFFSFASQTKEKK